MKLMIWCGFFAFVLSGCVVLPAHAGQYDWGQLERQQQQQRQESQRQWDQQERQQERNRLNQIEQQLRELQWQRGD